MMLSLSRVSCRFVFKRNFVITVMFFLVVANFTTLSQTIEDLKQGATDGDEYSIFFLGYCYFVGEGIEQNKEEARKWWEKLAEIPPTWRNKKYIAKAQWQLGIYYEEINQIHKAMHWWTKARKNGEKNATEKIIEYRNEIETQNDIELKELTINKAVFKMVFVAGGTFFMGGTNEQGVDAESDEAVREVNVDDFYIGQFEVTQSQWQAIMGSTIKTQRDLASPKFLLYGVGSDFPMYYVSWEDANAFCARLSKLSGKKFRLPTEAEWEYAARGGCNSGGAKYSGSMDAREVSWYSANSDGSTHEVGTKRANFLGIHDMSGNVNEWCEDWYGDYMQNDTNNPKGRSSGSHKVLRGGGWNNGVKSCRVSYRRGGSPQIREDSFGFRIVMSK